MDTIKKLLRKSIIDIEWWQQRTSEEFIRESMQRSIDDFKYLLKELEDNDKEIKE